MKIGIENYFNHIENPSCITDEKNYQKVKEAGFECIMLYGGQDVKEQVELCKKYDLEISYIHHPYIKENLLWEEGLAGDLLAENIEENLTCFASLKIPTVVVHCSSSNAFIPMQTPSEIGLARWKKICKHAKKVGIKIAFENLGQAGRNRLFKLLEQNKEQHVGFCYDCGHHNLWRQKEDIVKAFQDRIFAVHIHDNFGPPSTPLNDGFEGDQHMIPMTGTADWDYVTSALASSSYNGPMLLEIHKEFHERTKDEGLESYLTRAAETARKLAELIEKKRGK